MTFNSVKNTEIAQKSVSKMIKIFSHCNKSY